MLEFIILMIVILWVARTDKIKDIQSLSDREWEEKELNK